MNFQHKHIKDITNINKGTRDSWDVLRKPTSITKNECFCKFINIAHESTLRNRYAIEC